MLTVGGTYVEDIALPGAAWLTYVRSPLAHARIVAVDASEALALPGVLGVFTGDDLGRAGAARRTSRRSSPRACAAPSWRGDVVRYVGQPVVAVVAESRAVGEDATDLVLVDYDPLPVVIDPEVALRDDVLLFPDVGTNVVHRFASKTQADFSGCEVVVEERDRQPAPDRGADRAPLGRGLLDRRRPPRPLLRVPGRPPDPRPARRGVRPRPVAGARDRARRRRRLRRQVAHVSRGAGPRLLRPRPRAAGEVDRDPLGEHGGHAPRPGPASSTLGSAARRDGRITAYQLDVVQDAGAFPLMGAVLPMMTHADDDRRLRPRQRRLHRRLGGDEHGVDDGLPRGRAARGGGGHRADGRPVRRRDRHGPGRGAPAQPGAPLPRAVHHRHRDASTTSATTPRRSSARSRPPATTTLRAEQRRRRAGR